MPSTLASFSAGQRRDLLEPKLAQLLAESLPQHAAVILDARGNVIHWNPGAEKMLGLPAAEILGCSYALLFPPNDEPASPTPLLPCNSTTDRCEVDTLLARRDGSTFPARLTLVPYGESNPPDTFALLIHDLTERYRTEELLRARFVETAHLARLSTIGQLTAELAHEINQPLAAAANYARACVNFGRSGRAVIAPEVLDWMERSAAQAMRAVQISKRLGAFVKKVDGQASFVQVNSLVEQTLVLIRSMLLGNDESLSPITVETDLARLPAEILADQVQIEQVLLNLMRNAVEAMQELKSRRHVLTVRTSVDAEFVTVTVADTGPGIASDKLAGLFDPFFTTKPTGLGLGLSISRSIIEQHGGRITVESSQSGTTFSFTLPVPQGGPLSC